MFIQIIMIYKTMLKYNIILALFIFINKKTLQKKTEAHLLKSEEDFLLAYKE